MSFLRSGLLVSPSKELNAMVLIIQIMIILVRTSYLNATELEVQRPRPLFTIYSSRTSHVALTVVAQWVGHHPTN